MLDGLATADVRHLTCACLHTADGYSLEEARKKKEQDKLQAAADAKKQGVKAYVQDLRE